MISHTHDPSEEVTLDQQLATMDPALKASLQRQQFQQRRKLAVIGGILMMATLLCAVGISLFNVSAIWAGDEEAVKKAETAEQLATQGYKLWQEHKLVEAEKLLAKAVKVDPTHVNAWNALGWTRANQGLLSSAIEAFEKCVELNAEHPAALNGLGQAYFALREYEKAEGFLLKSEASSPAASAAWYGLMKLYLLQSKFDEAQKRLDKIEAADHGEVAGIDEIKKAIADKSLSAELKQQIEPPEMGKTERSAMELSQRGWQLFSSGKSHAAQVAFESALEVDSDLDSAKNGLAFSLLNQGQYSKARPIFEELIKLENPWGPMNGLARCLAREGKDDEAIAMWKKVDKATSGVNAGTAGLAYFLFEKQEYSDAIPYLKRMAKAQPQNEQIADMLSEAQSKVD